MNRARVVITGVGAITALGSSVKQYWEGLINGRSGIRRITQFDASDMPCQIAGEIPDFESNDYIDRKEARRIPRSGQIALAAAMQAVSDAGLPETMPNPERSGVCFGTAIGGVDRIDEGIHTIRGQGYARLNPFVLPSSIPNLSASKNSVFKADRYKIFILRFVLNMVWCSRKIFSDSIAITRYPDPGRSL